MVGLQERVQSLVHDGYRVLADIESVDPQEVVAVTLKNLLPVYILIRVVIPVVGGVNPRQILEVLSEAVVFDHKFPISSSVISINEQEVNAICRMGVCLVQLTQVLANLELWN